MMGNMLQRVWQQLDCRTDIGRVTKGGTLSFFELIAVGK
jgi:hypothetical protein